MLNNLSCSACTESPGTAENLCQQSLENCHSRCFTDTRNCIGGCDGAPVSMLEPREDSKAATERCCDANGCCGLYLRCCRNPFWPEFAHPTWLCCRDLYRQ